MGFLLEIGEMKPLMPNSVSFDEFIVLRDLQMFLIRCDWRNK